MNVVTRKEIEYMRSFDYVDPSKQKYAATLEQAVELLSGSCVRTFMDGTLCNGFDCEHCLAVQAFLDAYEGKE